MIITDRMGLHHDVDETLAFAREAIEDLSEREADGGLCFAEQAAGGMALFLEAALLALKDTEHHGGNTVQHEETTP